MLAASAKLPSFHGTHHQTRQKNITEFNDRNKPKLLLTTQREILRVRDRWLLITQSNQNDADPSRAGAPSAEVQSATSSIHESTQEGKIVDQVPASSPTPDDGPAAPVTWRCLFIVAVNKVRTNLWPLLLVHFCCDILVFGLHRASHRVTNERECCRVFNA